MSDSIEKRMVANTGYEVKHAIHIGDREVLVAENMADPDGQFYMKAEYTDNGIIGQYDRIIYSSSYLAVMEEFVGSLDRQAIALREEIGKTDYASSPITTEQCYPHDYGQSIDGKVVVIKAEVLRPEYRRGDRQLVLVDGGNGARGNARGSAVFCYHLHDGRHTRFERHDVLGVIKELPEWAAERMAAIRDERADFMKRKAEAPQHDKVAGYLITERIKVEKTLFVLGENPDAVSPYATWQQHEGRSGYDWGHYFSTHDKALEDLHARADRERDNISPDKTRKVKNRGNAR
jgi:hypothetical protein